MLGIVEGLVGLNSNGDSMCRAEGEERKGLIIENRCWTFWHYVSQ